MFEISRGHCIIISNSLAVSNDKHHICKHSNIECEHSDYSSNRCITWPRGYKTFFMLNSTEHAHKYKNIKKFGLFRLR